MSFIWLNISYYLASLWLGSVFISLNRYHMAHTCILQWLCNHEKYTTTGFVRESEMKFLLTLGVYQVQGVIFHKLEKTLKCKQIAKSHFGAPWLHSGQLCAVCIWMLWWSACKARTVPFRKLVVFKQFVFIALTCCYPDSCVSPLPPIGDSLTLGSTDKFAIFHF